MAFFTQLTTDRTVLRLPLNLTIDHLAKGNRSRIIQHVPPSRSVEPCCCRNSLCRHQRTCCELYPFEEAGLLKYCQTSRMVCCLSFRATDLSIYISTCRRAMSDDKKSQYIEAVQCLQKVPPTGSISEAKSLFDDFQGVHINLATQIHLVVCSQVTSSYSLPEYVNRDNSCRGTVAFSTYSRLHCGTIAISTARYRLLYSKNQGRNVLIIILFYRYWDWSIDIDADGT